MLRKKLPLLFKLFVLPLWIGMSSLTILFCFWILNMGAGLNFNEINEIIDLRSIAAQAQTYRLFAALPKKGAILGQQVDYQDARVVKLRDFFRFYNSPLENEADSFVQTADKYVLPWNLLPAIACKESGCGRVIPVGSFNPFGWAVYSGQNSGADFNSWAEAIETVAKGLREKYFDRGLDTVAAIETRYTPSSAATHNGWKETVEFFMGELENWKIKS